MIPRGRLDIRWRDILFGIGACLWPGDRTRMAERVERDAFEGPGLACLSVRSGFDALLTALDYPPGSEVLISALTIHDMVRIITEHGLVPVPLDLDMDALAIRDGDLNRQATARTVAIVVAHVFGADLPLDDVAALAQARGLLFVEDRAQVYAGGADEGHPAADVVLFSFGPIKTNTALGGAVLRFRDPGLRARVQAVLAGYPVQPRRRYLKRLVKYAGIKALANPRPFGLLAWAAPRFGSTHDQIISAALRGFPGAELFVQIRRQPSFPLLALLHRRLTTFDRGRIERRRRAAEQAASLLPEVRRPGAASAGAYPLGLSDLSPGSRRLDAAPLDARIRRHPGRLQPRRGRPAGRAAGCHGERRGGDDA